MKVLVTGGAGFIGSNFIYYMLEKHPDYEIVCLDALTYAGNLANLEPTLQNPRFRFMKEDITQRDRMFEIFEQEKFDVVVNFAAQSHVDNSLKQPYHTYEANSTGTVNLMDASRLYKVSRFHQVSTDEVYGDLPLDRPDLFFTEESPIHASSPYSASKASADLMVLAYHRSLKFPATLTRCSNNLGPYQFPEKLIPRMISLAQQDKSLPVYGKGENVRDWLYVQDHCSAIDTVLQRGQEGQVYNVGGNNERTNLEVVRTILRTLGKPESLIGFVTDRAGHDLRYAINSSKLQTLGWTPEYDFDKSIAETIKWYVEHPEWLELTASGGVYQNNKKILERYRK